MGLGPERPGAHWGLGGCAVKRVVVVLLAACAVALSVGVPEAFADIAVVPSKLEVFVAPGETLESSTTVVNNGDAPMRIDVRPWDFARDEQGLAQAIDPADAATFHACGGWMALDFGQDPVLQPGESRKLMIRTAVPADAEYGTYCTYLRLVATPTEAEQGAAPTALQVNALYLAIIYPPDARGQRFDQVEALVRQAVLETLEVPKASFGKPVVIQARLNNTGNVHINMEGYVDILEDGVVKQRLPIGECTMLPESPFSISRKWEDVGWFGHYVARFYADAGLEKPFMAERDFWILSPSFLGAVGGGVLLLVAFLTYFFRSFTFQRRVRSGGVSA